MAKTPNRSGGLLVGKTDRDGGQGIKVIAPEGDIVMGGGEVIINEEAAKLHCEELSEINQSTGGVAIPCDAQKTANKGLGNMEEGGKLNTGIKLNTQTQNEEIMSVHDLKANAVSHEHKNILGASTLSWVTTNDGRHFYKVFEGEKTHEDVYNFYKEKGLTITHTVIDVVTQTAKTRDLSALKKFVEKLVSEQFSSEVDQQSLMIPYTDHGDNGFTVNDFEFELKDGSKVKYNAQDQTITKIMKSGGKISFMNDGGEVKSGLRHARVTFDNGDVINTSINGTDEQIKDYYKIARSFNLGRGGNDLMAKVIKCEVDPDDNKMAEGGKIKSEKKLISAIKKEIANANDESYYGSEESEKNEQNILNGLKGVYGFDFETDRTEEEEQYILKATSAEIWQYYLDVIIPRIKASKSMDKGGKIGSEEKLISLIKKQIELHKDEDYYSSKSAEDNDKRIVKGLKNVYGFDTDADVTDEEHHYILKATPAEIWQYYLDVIIPRIKASKSMDEGGIVPSKTTPVELYFYHPTSEKLNYITYSQSTNKYNFTEISEEAYSFKSDEQVQKATKQIRAKLKSPELAVSMQACKYEKVETMSKGGKMDVNAYAAVSVKDGYWVVISKPTTKKIATEIAKSEGAVLKGEKGEVKTVKEILLHNKVLGREYLTGPSGDGKMDEGGKIPSATQQKKLWLAGKENEAFELLEKGGNPMKYTFETYKTTMDYALKGIKPANLETGGKISDLCPTGTVIQTLIFDKEKFNRTKANNWVKEHGFKNRIDITENSYRFRQYKPQSFKPTSFKTTNFDGKLPEGVQAVIGCLRSNVKIKK